MMRQRIFFLGAAALFIITAAVTTGQDIRTASNDSTSKSNSMRDFFPIGILTCGSPGQTEIPKDSAGLKEYFDAMCGDIAAHGMNMVVHFSSPTDWVEILLESAQRYNLKVLPSVNELLRLNTKDDKFAQQDEINQAAGKVTAALKKYDSLLGYYTCDEPTGTKMNIENLARINKAVEEADTARYAFNIIDKAPRAGEFCDKAKPKVMMYNPYPLNIHSPIGQFGTFTSDIDAVRSSIPPETPLWMVIQTHWFDKEVNYLREPLPAEIRAMTYLSVAHGAKGIIYFLYQTLGKMYGLVDNNYKPTVRWDEIARLSRDIELISPVLLKLNVTENIATASGNSDVQTLTDKTGNRYLMVVNKDVIKPQSIEIAVTEKGGGMAKNIEDVLLKKTVVSMENTEQMVKFRCLLPPGDGRLFRLVAVR